MSGWTKLFSSLPTSSIWSEDYATRIVWTTMLAVADMEGLVEGSVPGFARLANVTVDEMQAAIQKLSAPDPYSRTPDHKGRRIEPIEGGWRILNYRLYRERGQAKDGSKAPAMRAYRARQRSAAAGGPNKSVTQGNALPESVTSDPEARGKRQEERHGGSGRRGGLLRGPDPNCYRDGPGSLGVPQRLHRDFMEQRTARGMTDQDATRELEAFYDRWTQAYTDGDRRTANMESDRFKFWRARHDESWPAAAPSRAVINAVGAGPAVPSAAATREMLRTLEAV